MHAEMGGWCETCSEIYRYCLRGSTYSKVSEMSGLNGFEMRPIVDESARGVVSVYAEGLKSS